MLCLKASLVGSESSTTLPRRKVMNNPPTVKLIASWDGGCKQESAEVIAILLTTRTAITFHLKVALPRRSSRIEYRLDPSKIMQDINQERHRVLNRLWLLARRCSAADRSVRRCLVVAAGVDQTGMPSELREVRLLNHTISPKLDCGVSESVVSEAT